MKLRIMYDLQGVLFSDKVFDVYGRRLLPRVGGKHMGSRRISDKKDIWNITRVNVYSRAKDQSEMSKFVEQLIDKG